MACFDYLSGLDRMRSLPIAAIVRLLVSVYLDYGVFKLGSFIGSISS